MGFIFIAPELKPDVWVKEIRRIVPDLDIRIWPDVENPDDITFALAWNAPMGVFGRFRNLRCIASLGAGVDHILKDPDLPAGVAVTRIVEPSMSQYMREYVAMAVLNHCRHWAFYRECQGASLWRKKMPRFAENTPVGVMGLGQLGQAVAQTLVALGFPVSGWRRTAEMKSPFPVFTGKGELAAFLASSHILVCLLPLTPETRHILNRDTLSMLPEGAYVINAARGGHLVEADLLAAIDSGRLAGACLDVFEKEPLPAEHPFWRHPRITVTPHVSSVTNPGKVASLVMENYRRSESGEPLLHLVDRTRGY